MKKILRQLNIVKLGMVLALVVCATAPAQAQTVSKEEIIRLTNQERSTAGVQTLVENELLDKAAMLKAQDMIGHNYFAHTSPAGVDPWHWFGQADYQYKFAGENLAMDFASASSVTKAWMNSPTHKENILSNKFQEIGVAVMQGVIDGKETQVAVQMFGTRLGQEVQGVSDEQTTTVSSLKIEEATIYPWKGQASDELLVYARINGQPAKVEALVGDKRYELQKHREGSYMNLLLLNEVNVETNPIMIKASEDENKYVFHEISTAQVKEALNKENKQAEEPVIASANQGDDNVYVKSFLKQNIFLSVGLILFLIMIANVWILEKEEEQLIEHQTAA